MKAEYFPPKEDVILQNEAPTDFYILVTGAVVIIQHIYFSKSWKPGFYIFKWSSIGLHPFFFSFFLKKKKKK